MAGSSAKGGLGWVILVIALAVPGVLFYNWWSHLKAEREKSVAAKARTRVPDGGVFQPSPNGKLVNPMAPVASTAAVVAVVASTAAALAAAPAPGAAVPGLAPAALQAGTTGPASPAFSTSTVQAPPLKRDPTLSPFDLLRIAEEEQARIRAAEELAAMQAARQNRGKKPKKATIDPTKLINLQGIVSNPDSGFKAIVNDEVLGTGEFIGSTKIKIVKITDLGVTFDYQGKRFSKGVSRD